MSMLDVYILLIKQIFLQDSFAYLNKNVININNIVPYIVTVRFEPKLF